MGGEGEGGVEKFDVDSEFLNHTIRIRRVARISSKLNKIYGLKPELSKIDFF